MATQTQDNKDRLTTIKSAQNALVYDIIMQGLRAARAAGSPLSVWVDKNGGLMVSAGDKLVRGFARFGDNISNSEISCLIGIVEWLQNGAPEEKDEPKEEEEDD